MIPIVIEAWLQALIIQSILPIDRDIVDEFIAAASFDSILEENFVVLNIGELGPGFGEMGEKA
jgi:hypothetical protein